jgi:hypothetical protein
MVRGCISSHTGGKSGVARIVRGFPDARYDHFLTKPCDPNVVLKLVASFPAKA